MALKREEVIETDRVVIDVSIGCSDLNRQSSLKETRGLESIIHM